MTEELRTRFLSRFVATARQRMERSQALLCKQGGAAALASELHALAGEAAVLGLAELAELARAGEAIARRRAADDGEPLSSCAQSLAAIGRALDDVALSAQA